MATDVFENKTPTLPPATLRNADPRSPVTKWDTRNSAIFSANPIGRENAKNAA